MIFFNRVIFVDWHATAQIDQSTGFLHHTGYSQSRNPDASNQSKGHYPRTHASYGQICATKCWMIMCTSARLMNSSHQIPRRPVLGYVPRALEPVCPTPSMPNSRNIENRRAIHHQHYSSALGTSGGILTTVQTIVGYSSLRKLRCASGPCICIMPNQDQPAMADIMMRYHDPDLKNLGKGTTCVEYA